MKGFTIGSRKLLAVASIVLLIVLLAVPMALAFEGRGGERVVVEADEVIDDDLYVAAGEFVLDGTVTGDLIVAGSTIEINGEVQGDVIAAGQSVVINGSIGDDARIAGYALVVGGGVEDDLLAGGFSLENQSESSVGGDFLFGGYQALLAGDVAGNARLGAGAVKVGGNIDGDLTVDLGETDPDEPVPPGFPFFTPPNTPPLPTVPVGLTVEESASIGGDLNYTALAETEIPPEVVAGDVDFDRYVPETEPGEKFEPPSTAAVVGRWFLRQVRRLITLLLIGAAMMWLIPDWTRRIAGIVQSKPLPSLGWGVVATAAFLGGMAVLAVATVLLAIFFGIITLGELAGRFAMLGGLVLSTAGFGFSITWAYVTRIAISLLLGQLIFQLFDSKAADHRWWPMLMGVVIFAVITAVPVLGWLLSLVAVLLGLGAIWLWGRDRLAARRAAQAA